MLFCRNVDRNLETLHNRLVAGNIRWGPYHQFTITDPKKRIISAVPIEDRILHHAVMNILEPLFERQMVYHTYACRYLSSLDHYVLEQIKPSAYVRYMDDFVLWGVSEGYLQEALFQSSGFFFSHSCHVFPRLNAVWLNSMLLYITRVYCI
jgi:hypothetical protein